MKANNIVYAEAHNEPAILTANTYFWTPSANAHNRRSNEAKKLQEAEAWIEKFPYAHFHLQVEFSYSESCKNVYKHFTVIKWDGGNGNINTFRKLYTENGRQQLRKEHEKWIKNSVTKKICAA